MKKILISVGFVLAFVAPGFAQSYSASYGTGNLIDVPLAEKSNGAYGYAGTVPPQTSGAVSTSRAASGISAYAYSPPGSHRHKLHGKRLHRPTSAD